MSSNKRNLMDLMNSGYPDGFMASYYDGNGDLIPLAGSGLDDGLARFLTAEASDLYDDSESLDQNKQRIVQALLNSVADIEAVIRKLEE